MNARTNAGVAPLPQMTTPAALGTSTRADAVDYSAKKKRRKIKKVVVEMAEGTSWPWTALLGMTEYESKEQRLHDEIVAYVAYINPTKQEKYARSQVITRIGDVVRARFPRFDLETFGSTAQDIYLPDGDIDLVMTSWREPDRATKVTMLYALSGALRDASITRNPFVVRNARVPVVSFETTPELGSYKCDINLNPEGMRSVVVISEYLNNMPALRYIVLVVKGYLSRLQLGSTGSAGLSSYSIILMAISFLQRNPKNLPLDDIAKPLQRESLGRLLLGFLEHYGFDFDYVNSVVSVSRHDLTTKASKGWVAEKQTDLLSIEDPVNADNDVGRSTTKIKQVRTAFCDAYKELQTYPLSMAHTNALGTILGMSPETVARREKLREIVDSGSLGRSILDVRVPTLSVAPRRFHTHQPHNGYAPYHPQQRPRSYYSGQGSQTDGYSLHEGPPAQQGSYGFERDPAYDAEYGPARHWQPPRWRPP